MSKNTTAKAKEIQAKADKIEALLSNPKSSKALHYALGGLLIELSNESQTSVDFPGSRWCLLPASSKSKR